MKRGTKEKTDFQGEGFDFHRIPSGFIFVFPSQKQVMIFFFCIPGKGLFNIDVSWQTEGQMIWTWMCRCKKKKMINKMQRMLIDLQLWSLGLSSNIRFHRGKKINLLKPDEYPSLDWSFDSLNSRALQVICNVATKQFLLHIGDKKKGWIGLFRSTMGQVMRNTYFVVYRRSVCLGPIFYKNIHTVFQIFSLNISKSFYNYQ